MIKPIVQMHDGILVVRDDLYPGGTKARFLPLLFNGVNEVVYASPPEGGAQTALAVCAQSLGKHATIFVAKRKKPHPRALMAKRLGATVVQVKPGYLSVVQARAKAYCKFSGARLVPFGVDLPEAIAIIAEAAKSIEEEPDEVWCAAGSGVLARGLAKAWPNAKRHVVQVGRQLTSLDVAGAIIHVYPQPFSTECPLSTPFPADHHYDAKAWQVAVKNSGPGKVLFWNVTGPAKIEKETGGKAVLEDEDEC